jgi:selenocysteine lyase/cysteine desulfurase
MDRRPEYDLAEIRAEIPLLRSRLPMNNCSQAPLFKGVRDGAMAFLESWEHDGMDWEGWVAEVEAARHTFADLIGAEPDEVSVASSVSQATASLASALSFEAPRNKIVLSDAEFPSVGQIWSAQRARGAHLDWAGITDGAVDMEALEKAVDSKTALVSITHGAYQTGSLQDVARVAKWARASGAISFVDAYQTLGNRRVLVRDLGIDVLVGGCLKYLLGTAGIAFMYVRRDLAERLEPTSTGWFGRANPFAFDPKVLDWGAGARRFDTGTPPLLPAYIARAGMELVRSVGLEKIERWNRTLTNRMILGGITRGLRLEGPRDPDHRTPVAAFHAPQAAMMEAALRERGILASARGSVLRLAPHFYNSLEDVDEALDALVEVLSPAT